VKLRPSGNSARTVCLLHGGGLGSGEPWCLHRAIDSSSWPAEGLAALAEIDAATLDDDQPYDAARADLLTRAGQRDEALGAYDRAIELTTNAVEGDFLVRQLGAL
jgi:RNA polymerase sigma-70 factor (ECF subfamily)